MNIHTAIVNIKDIIDFSDKMVAVNKDGEVGCAEIRGKKEIGRASCRERV